MTDTRNVFELLEKCKETAINSGAWESYAAVREAFEELRTALAQKQEPHECTRSHPHELMDGYCQLRTEIARLTNENARLKAAPQQAVQPMTDDQIEEMYEEQDFSTTLFQTKRIVRETEKHYGIGEKE